MIEKKLGKAAFPGIKITFIVQEEPLGLAHAVLTARPFLKNSSFVMVLGDNLYDHNLQDALYIFQKEKADALACLTPVEEPGLYGIAEVRHGHIVSLEEKPENPRSNLAIMGIYFFKHSIFSAVERITPSKRGELEITDAMRELINMGGKVIPYSYPGWWMDIGRPEDVLRANRQVLQRMFGLDKSGHFFKAPAPRTMPLGDKMAGGSGAGDSISEVTFPEAPSSEELFLAASAPDVSLCRVAPSAVISGSRLKGPLVIGDKCRITGSYIGPYTSIGPGSVVENSFVENSVLFEGVSIKSLKNPIRESILGEGASIWGRGGMGRKPKKFLLGAGSSIYL
jgi:glucose-1-phosphate thymidylyltransferase